MPSLAAASTNWLIRDVACRTENWVWLCKCTKAASCSAVLTVASDLVVGVFFSCFKAAEASFRFWWVRPAKAKGCVCCLRAAV